MNTENSTRSEAGTPERGDALKDVRTVVVKVGTNVLSRPDGDMALGRIHGLIENLADLRRRGIKVILVSSGAISMGMNRLEFDKRPTSLQDKQACAAIGQIQLMAVYQQGFDRYQLPTAQLLLTEDDFASRTRYLNLRNTMFRLLEMGVLPIVNENDSISTSEIEEPGTGKGAVFGDNDELSALVASKLDADLLLLLTDVNGLYASSPDPGNGEKPLSIVREITSEITAMAGDSSDERSRGGMGSKLQAITIAVQSGIPAIIVNGLTADVVRDALAGEDVGTLFLPGKRLKSRKHWIAYASSTTGLAEINPGAREALAERGSSLLFTGTVRIEGDFKRGDVISIIDDDGQEFARGISNYDSRQAEALLGKELDEIADADFPEFITRDNIALKE
ncbi:MAG: glutamate 5-kinase [Planctomycetes bacterium]|nr:glutamate 5-kinase [Planctomycetota bacterium]